MSPRSFGQWTPQDSSGVCRECGLPLFGHRAGRCLSESEADALDGKLARWFAVVHPARNKARAAKRACGLVRGRFREREATLEELTAAETARGVAQAEYLAAITQADEEASRGTAASKT
jgi:hypothetical protein